MEKLKNELREKAVAIRTDSEGGYYGGGRVVISKSDLEDVVDKLASYGYSNSIKVEDINTKEKFTDFVEQYFWCEEIPSKERIFVGEFLYGGKHELYEFNAHLYYKNRKKISRKEKLDILFNIWELLQEVSDSGFWELPLAVESIESYIYTLSKYSEHGQNLIKIIEGGNDEPCESPYYMEVEVIWED